MKKKVLAALSLSIVLSLTACGEAAAPSNTPVSDSQTEIVEEVEEAEETADEEEEVAETDDENAQYAKQRGVAGYIAENNMYINEFFGFAAMPYPGYSYLSDKIIEQASGNSCSAHLDEETITETLDSHNQLVEYVLSDPRMNNYATVFLYEMDDSSMTMDDVESLIDVTVPIMADMYSGLEDLVCEKSSVTFLGEETPCIRVYGDYDGTEMNLIMVFMIKDGYCASISVQGESEEEIGKLTSLYVKLD